MHRRLAISGPSHPVEEHGRAQGSSLSGITIGIDASRNRSGGAKAHLIGILELADIRVHIKI